MGYLRRPVRRRAARAEKLAHWDAARDLDPQDWSQSDLPTPRIRDVYLRFVIQDQQTGWIGLFRASDVLDDDATLPDSVRSQMRSTFRWFARHLRAPRGLPRNAVCWFRADASDDCIEHLRELIELYRMSGRTVMMQSTRDPGRIVYRDQQQVAAVPVRGRRIGSSAW